MSSEAGHIILNPSEISCREISDPAVLPETPMVSVSMITYNHGPYIARAVEGVLTQQTNFPFELVIGEDCSTDGTRGIVLDFQKRYPNVIRVVTSDHNVGMHKNGRRVINACRGKYIAFCEGDDYWHHPQKLQMQLDYLEAHPECGLVHSDCDRLNLRTGTRKKNVYAGLRKERTRPNVLHGMIANEYGVETCTAVVRREILNEIYRECPYEFSDTFMMGDVQIWIETAYRMKVKYMRESLATRHLLPESASRTRDLERIVRFIMNARAIHMHYADKYGGGDSPKLKKKIVESHDQWIIRFACRAGMTELAAEIRQDSRKYDAPLGCAGRLFCYGSRKGIFPFIVRKIILLPGQCLRMLRNIQCLRTLRNRIKGWETVGHKEKQKERG